MSIQHRIDIARKHFNIVNPSDWASIRPEWILKLKDCGPATLNHIRLYLVPHGITLRDDSTVEFWAKHLTIAKIGGQISETDTLEIEPYTILIASNEQQPWTFQGNEFDGRQVIVPFKICNLGESRGDYSVVGCEDSISIERKSVSDAIGTFLTHDEQRREAWLRTMQYLAEIPSGAVYIEGTQYQCFREIQSRGRRSQDSLRREFRNSVAAWSEDFCLRFKFFDTRLSAEKEALWVLRRHWMQTVGLKERHQSGEHPDDIVARI